MTAYRFAIVAIATLALSFVIAPAPAREAKAERRINPCLFERLVPFLEQPLPPDRPNQFNRSFRGVA